MAGKQYQCLLKAPVIENREFLGAGVTPCPIRKAQLTNLSADEPRRSGRPTKGQHTKMDVLEQTPEPKKKGTKKGKKQAVQEEEVEVIRCVCGAIATLGDDDPEPWIACDICGVWQHNVCMGIPTYDDEIPDKYSCELCAPEQHQELLASMARGEKIWEDRRQAYEKLQEQEEQASKKKGKKGKAKRQSDPKSEISTSNGKAKSPSIPVSDTKRERKETPVRAGSTKRKARDESHESSKVSWIWSHYLKHTNRTTGKSSEGPQSFYDTCHTKTKIAAFRSAGEGC